MGRSAPRLQHFHIGNVPYPELPTLLLSARNLVSLHLDGDYISPEAMVVCLAGMARLRTLCICTALTPPEQARRPSTLAILPALTEFIFAGANEYLEDFVAQIDTPRINCVNIMYSMDEVQTRQLCWFIDRTAKFKYAQITFSDNNVELDCPRGERHQVLLITALGRGVEFQVPFVVHVPSQLDTMLSNMSHLFVSKEPCWEAEMDMAEWLSFLRIFPVVEAMYASGVTAGYITSALEDIPREIVTKVLPAPLLLCLDDDDDNDDRDRDDYAYEKIKPVGPTGRFLSLRQLSGLPVTIVKTQDEFIERLLSHQTQILFDKYESPDLDSG